MKPFNDYLYWELKNHPLLKLPIEIDNFLLKIEIIGTTANFEVQKEIYNMVKELAMSNGHEGEIRDWEDHYFG